MEIKDPPTIVSKIKNKDKSIFDECIEMPDVDKDEVIAKSTLANPSSGITKKYKKNVNIRIIDPRCKSS